MRVNLKSNQYYDFFNIRKIITSTNYISIDGNFEKGKKYTMVALNFGMIDPKSLKDLKYHMKNNMKRFDFEGCCPYCEAVDILIRENQTHKREMNSPKPRFYDVDVKKINCICEHCKKVFDYNQRKYSDVILYYT